MKRIVFTILMIGPLPGFAAEKTLDLQQILALALTQSPSVKAKLAEAEISQAQMQQLGLIESPQLGGGVLFPINSPRAQVGYEVRLTFNLMDLIQLPARKKFGQAEYEKRKWEIASDVLQILTTIKISYYEYQALLQLKMLWKSSLDTVKSMSDLSSAQRKAGNISELENAQQLAFTKMAQLELSKVENQIKQERIELAKWAGLDVHESSWEIMARLPALPGHLPELEALKEQAQKYRPYTLAHRKKVESSKRSVELARLGVFPRINLGVSSEWDVEGNWGIGPVLQFGIPFLGHQSANLRKARAELNANQLELSAVEQNTPNDLERFYEQLSLSSQMVRFYQSDVLPLQERILKESLKHYNYMLIGNFQLLMNKQNQIHAQKESILELKNYWIANAELENLTGGPQ